MTKFLAIALIVGSAARTLAAQSLGPAGTVCGKVIRGDTNQPLGNATVVARSYLGIPPYPVQKTAADGSFCFRSLSTGQYNILAFKAGFINLSLQYPSIMAKPNEPVAAVVVRMAAALPVLSTRGVFDSVLRPEQRRELSIQAAKFSPDGRYLAIVAYITGEDSSYGSQVFRYDLVTRKLIGVTPEPTLHTLPSVDQTVWSGDVLYSSVTYTWEMGRSAFFKTTDESTIPIDSFPTELEKPGLGNPFHQPVGPYLVDGEEVHGGGTELSVGKKVIAWVGGPWAFLDNPPVVIYGGNGVHIFHLRTRHDERVNIPNGSGTVVLDATPHSTGLRIAYLSGGECGVDPQSIPPDYAWPQTSLQRLCFVDISEVSRPGLSPQGSASK